MSKNTCFCALLVLICAHRLSERIKSFEIWTQSSSQCGNYFCVLVRADSIWSSPLKLTKSLNSSWLPEERTPCRFNKIEGCQVYLASAWQHSTKIPHPVDRLWTFHHANLRCLSITCVVYLDASTCQRAATMSTSWPHETEEGSIILQQTPTSFFG